MKRTWILLVFAAFSLVGQAQTRAIDSLETLISKEQNDIARIDLKNKLITNLKEFNLDSSIVVGNKVVEEAHEIDYRKGEANALNNTSEALLRKGEFGTAREYLDRALAIMSEQTDSSSLAAIYRSYGIMYGMQGQYDTSNTYFNRALHIFEAVGDSAMMGTCYGNLAIGYQMQSNFPQALQYQQKSLKIAEGQNSVSGQAYTLLNMGQTYFKMGDSLRAEKMMLRSIDFSIEGELKNVEVYGYTNLASLYYARKDWPDTYKYGVKAGELAKEIGDKPIEAASYSKAATALAHMGKFEEAKELIDRGMPDAESSGQPLIINQLNMAMGNTLSLEGKYQEAIPYFEKGLAAVSESDEYDQGIGAIRRSLSEAYEKTGAYEQALIEFKKYAAINDSVMARANIQKATEQTMTFEFEKTRAETKAVQAVKDAETKRTRSRQYFVIALLGLGLLAVVVMAWMQYRSKQNKQKANLLLQSQKQKVENTLAELESTQAQLIQSEKMAGLGELTAGIAHEIQNPLNFVNNFSEVSRELLDEMKEELDLGHTEEAKSMADAVIDNLEKIHHHGRRADSIVKGMLLHTRSGSGTREPTDLNVLADEYLRLAYHGLRAKDKSFNAAIKSDFDPSIGMVNLIPQDMGRVVLNLITNAFYAVNQKKQQGDENYKPEVEVRTARSGDEIELSVRDNGNGIAEHDLKKIFQPFFTTKPTGQGTGLGLSLSYDIVRAHGGDLTVDTKPGEGSVFTIRFNNRPINPIT